MAGISNFGELDAALGGGLSTTIQFGYPLESSSGTAAIPGNGEALNAAHIDLARLKAGVDFTTESKDWPSAIAAQAQSTNDPAVHAAVHVRVQDVELITFGDVLAFLQARIPTSANDFTAAETLQFLQTNLNESVLLGTKKEELKNVLLDDEKNERLTRKGNSNARDIDDVLGAWYHIYADSQYPAGDVSNTPTTFQNKDAVDNLNVYYAVRWALEFLKKGTTNTTLVPTATAATAATAAPTPTPTATTTATAAPTPAFSFDSFVTTELGTGATHATQDESKRLIAGVMLLALDRLDRRESRYARAPPSMYQMRDQLEAADVIMSVSALVENKDDIKKLLTGIEITNTADSLDQTMVKHVNRLNVTEDQAKKIGEESRKVLA